MKRPVVLFALMLLFHGCAYAVSRDLAARADKTITFEMLQAEPDAFTGKLLILGGTLSHITSTKEGVLLEVVQKPLDYWGRPKRTDRTGGRFLVRSAKRLDAMIFAPGRDITVAAEVEGTRGKALGDLEYSYPVVVLRELKLWEREYPSWNRPQWIDPLYDPAGPGRSDW
jgi:outer membrane lipoprotein